jgi:hypothetical protein
MQHMFEVEPYNIMFYTHLTEQYWGSRGGDKYSQVIISRFRLLCRGIVNPLNLRMISTHMAVLIFLKSQRVSINPYTKIIWNDYKWRLHIRCRDCKQWRRRF